MINCDYNTAIFQLLVCENNQINLNVVLNQ